MLKKYGFTFLISLIILGVHAQDEKDKNLTIFKFNPLQLVTSSLSFSVEKFNYEQKRSNNLTIGIRYKDDVQNYYNNNIGANGDIIDNYDTWKGLTAIYERRIYVPRFKEGKPNFINTESSQNGVYLAPSLRVDYTNRSYSNGYFETKFDNTGNVVGESKIFNAGNVTYLGVMPAINLGIQFSIFQYGYIDLFVGGGVRFQDENIKDQVVSRNNYYGNSSAIDELVLREGVRPNGGISIGVKF